MAIDPFIRSFSRSVGGGAVRSGSVFDLRNALVKMALSPMGRHLLLRSLSLFALAAFLLNSCKHEPLVAPEDPFADDGGGGEQEPEPEDTCDENTIWFEQEVLNIFLTNCALSGCHGDIDPQDDELVFTSWAGITAGDTEEDIWEAINEDPDDNDHMPPLEDDNGNTLDQLSAEEIAIIGAWISQGANNTSCEGGCQLTNVTYSGTIAPIVQDRCLGSCHAGGNPAGGIMLSSWAGLNAVAIDGRLALAVQHLPGAVAMPQSGPMLSQCRIDQILAWIQNGAPNN